MLVRELSAEVESFGYSLVVPPPFEQTEVFDRIEGAGVGALKFVDPGTGDVAAFRTDLTPQLARIAATRMREVPAPLRLYYEGNVIRERTGRARRQRQIAQFGAEFLGAPAARGDAEIVRVASGALLRIGLPHQIELAFVPLVRALVGMATSSARPILEDAISRKDAESVARVAHLESDPLRRALVELCSSTGGFELLSRAEELLRPLDAASILRPLHELRAALDEIGLEVAVRLDLGEIRGSSYYTGPSFSLLADGPGEALGGGGRYDNLVEAYGRSLPAVGFALDIEHVLWALRLRKTLPARARRLVGFIGPERGATALRRLGLDVAQLSEPLSNAISYASAWGLDFVVTTTGDGRWHVHSSSNSTKELDDVGLQEWLNRKPD